MSGPHRIRLQGPWQVRPPGCDADAVFMDVKLPASWSDLFGMTSGIACFRRGFNTPTNLNAQDQVMLILPDDVGSIRSCSINGVKIDASATHPTTFDVTTHLKPFNQIELELWFNPADNPGHPGGLWAPVQLEIHAADFN